MAAKGTGNALLKSRHSHRVMDGSVWAKRQKDRDKMTVTERQKTQNREKNWHDNCYIIHGGGQNRRHNTT